MFKNISYYALSGLDKSPIAIETYFVLKLFQESGALTERNYGVVNLTPDQFTFKKGKGILFAIKLETKPVNGKAVNQKTMSVIKKIKLEENRKVTKAEKDTIKQEIYHDALLKALPVTETIIVYLTDRFVAVDSSSSKKVEDVLSYLRSILGSLECEPIINTVDFQNQFTDWVLSPAARPLDIELSSPFRLNHQDGEGYLVFKGLEIDVPGLPSIKEYLKAYNVSQLVIGLNKGQYQLQISDKLILTNCKFSDGQDDEQDDAATYMITDAIEFVYSKLLGVFNV